MFVAAGPLSNFEVRLSYCAASDWGLGGSQRVHSTRGRLSKSSEIVGEGQIRRQRWGL